MSEAAIFKIEISYSKTTEKSRKKAATVYT
jgi:hypothetical protein